VVPATISQRHADIRNSTFEAVYVISDRQTIRSGAGDKRVSIDVQSFEPSLQVLTVPKFGQTAYLQAKFKLATGLLLLPGETSLYRDGVFVGHGSLPQLSGGEEHELGFGADDKVKVSFVNLGRKAGQTGLISTSMTDTQSYKTTITNLHSGQMSVRLLDQVPVSLNDQIKVDMASVYPTPSQQDFHDKKGVLAWDFMLQPNEQKDVTFGYVVSWPVGKSVTYGGQPEPDGTQ
jgi:uncharacterized protein (TIGR02231 family)